MSQIDKGYLDENTTLVTLSIGGNDARFADIIKECVYASGAWPCQDSKLGGEDEDLKVTVPRNINGRVRSSIAIVLREIHKRAPNAEIVLMGYPQLLSGDGGCIPGIWPSEASWLNEMGRVLAESMATAVRDVAESDLRVPASFADPIAAGVFNGRAICGDPETIHGVVENTTAGDKPKSLGLLPPSQQSFHPKIDGNWAYAVVLNETLKDLGL